MTISNSIKEESFNFDEAIMLLQWLLFDKGLDGSTKSFNPVPLNEKTKKIMS